MDTSTSQSWTTREQDLLASLGGAERRRLGCYLTPWPVAHLMTSLLSPEIRRSGHIIDPAAGSGRLLAAAKSSSPEGVVNRLHGVEPQPALTSLANEVLGHPCCRVGDALELLRPDRRQALLGRSEFDAVIANPPYVREKQHADVFRSALAREPAWTGRFQPRQDLQQLFLGLALEWLRPGGELVFLMNPYWLQSDSGQALREELGERADILAVVDFGPVRLFPEAKGQHHLLIHGRRKGDAPVGPTRVVRLTSARAPLATVCAELAGTFQNPTATGEQIQVSGPRRRWYLVRAATPVERLEREGVPLGASFRTHQGVVSGADRVTARNLPLISGAHLGEGVFVLSGAEAAAIGPSGLRRVYRARDIRPARIAEPREAVIYAHRGFELARFPAINDHLARFRPLLSARRECRLGVIPWYELHWPRDPRLFGRPRLVTPRRATEPRFAFAPEATCEQSDIALITDPGDDRVRLAALLVVLHSPTIRAWCAQRGKQKGAVREFFGRALEEIPLPRTIAIDPDAFLALAPFASPNKLESGAERVERLYGGLFG